MEMSKNTRGFEDDDVVTGVASEDMVGQMEGGDALKEASM
jgi:hypothetical protein